MCNYTVNVPRHLKEEPRFRGLMVMGVSPGRKMVRMTMTVRRLKVLVVGVSHRLVVLLLLVIRVARCQHTAKFDPFQSLYCARAIQGKEGIKFCRVA